jgi:hypothetical protein
VVEFLVSKFETLNKTTLLSHTQKQTTTKKTDMSTNVTERKIWIHTASPTWCLQRHPKHVMKKGSLINKCCWENWVSYKHAENWS